MRNNTFLCKQITTNGLSSLFYGDFHKETLGNLKQLNLSVLPKCHKSFFFFRKFTLYSVLIDLFLICEFPSTNMVTDLFLFPA